ncbi:AHH domain-containing protein [Pyxidicoccus trucidator]|uniref:AHH domain-containing protein n=1 Tax=Pyxidicoccus trucidator TaxID=2709662 RepID=UPI0013D94FC8|nr:AHH domain-containing protein [Pyxidicoccus trucidator]
MVRRSLWWALVLLPWVVGCASTRVVRLDTGEGAPLEYAPASWDASVRVDSDDFEEALTRLVLEVPLSLRPSQAGLLVRAGTWGAQADSTWQGALRKDYGRWCQAREGGDCLSLLEDGLGLGEMDRLTLALGFAMDPLREAVFEAVSETLNPRVFYAVVVTGLATWVALLAAPEPFVTKAAAVLSAVMVVYLGVGPFLALVRASFELKGASDRARTFAELEAAGERFGRVLGTEGTQVAILALAALLGQGMAGTSARLASRLEMMPGFARAAALGEAQVGLRLAAVGEVTSVAVAADGTLVVALPATAVAMAASGGDGKHKHHIATIRNEVSTARGGPWTPRFKELFRKAGMTLDEVENIVPIQGHKGPHPEAYHGHIFDKLSGVVNACRGVAQCQLMLKAELRRLAKQIATPGTKLHQLVTQGAPR